MRSHKAGIAHNARRKTPIAFLHRLVWVHFPNGVAAIDSRLLGGRLVRTWFRAGSYVWNDNHPLVLVCVPVENGGEPCLTIPDLLPWATCWGRICFPSSCMATHVRCPYDMGASSGNFALYLDL